MKNERAVRVQGFIFVGLAWLAVIAAWSLPALNPMTSLLFASLMIFFLGVPHGALDPLFAAKHPKMKGAGTWVVFLTAYLLLTAAVVGLWVVSPVLFFLLFLGLSIFHFSGDLTGGATFAERFFYGGSVVVLPALIHHTELLRIFSMLTGHQDSVPIVKFLGLIAWPWLACQVLVAFKSFKHDRLRAAEILSLALLMLTAEPLLGFTVYFCAMHSARHLLRTQQFTLASPNKMLAVATGPMLAVLGLVVAVGYLRPEVAFEEGLVQLVFVGLAALTVPHMLLIERVRLANWQQKEN